MFKVFKVEVVSANLMMVLELCVATQTFVWVNTRLLLLYMLQRAYLACPVRLQISWVEGGSLSFKFRSEVTDAFANVVNHPVWVRQIMKLYLRHNSQF